MKYTTKFTLLLAALILSTGCVTQARYDELYKKYDVLQSEKDTIEQNLSSAQSQKAGKIFRQQQRIDKLEKNIHLLKTQCKEKITELTSTEGRLTQELQALHAESSENTKYLLNKNLELQEGCNGAQQE